MRMSLSSENSVGLSWIGGKVSSQSPYRKPAAWPLYDSGMMTKLCASDSEAFHHCGSLAANLASRAFSMKITRSLLSDAWNTFGS